MSDALVERLAGVLGEHDEPERMRVAPAERRMRYYRSQARALLPVVEQEIAAARAEHGERIAQAIEAVQSPSLSITENGHLGLAALIARNAMSPEEGR